jgi:hypothetical protein
MAYKVFGMRLTARDDERIRVRGLEATRKAFSEDLRSPGTDSFQ